MDVDGEVSVDRQLRPRGVRERHVVEHELAPALCKGGGAGEGEVKGEGTSEGEGEGEGEGER